MSWKISLVGVAMVAAACGGINGKGDGGGLRGDGQVRRASACG